MTKEFCGNQNSVGVYASITRAASARTRESTWRKLHNGTPNHARTTCVLLKYGPTVGWRRLTSVPSLVRDHSGWELDAKMKGPTQSPEYNTTAEASHGEE